MPLDRRIEWPSLAIRDRPRAAAMGRCPGILLTPFDVEEVLIRFPLDEIDHQRRGLVSMGFEQEMRTVEDVGFHPWQSLHP